MFISLVVFGPTQCYPVVPLVSVAMVEDNLKPYNPKTLNSEIPTLKPKPETPNWTANRLGPYSFGFRGPGLLSFGV